MLLVTLAVGSVPALLGGHPTSQSSAAPQPGFQPVIPMNAESVEVLELGFVLLQNGGRSLPASQLELRLGISLCLSLLPFFVP